MRTLRLDSGSRDLAVEILCDAFQDYPVMRFVLGTADAGSAADLAKLIGFFVTARFLREEPVLAVTDSAGVVCGIATVSPPCGLPSPAALVALRESLWRDLGDDARRRYEAFTAASDRSGHAAPHHHLNMIGIRGSHRGRGFARPLLEAVHALAASEPGSAGTGLTTETPENVELYRRFGYQILGHERVADGLETWAMFRAR